MATDSAPQMSRVLMPPDPSSIPGYTDHRVHRRLSGRKPYVELKSSLLHSPTVQSSHRMVLQPAHGSCWGATPPGLGACRGAGAQPLSCTAIPGYTGFIPRAQHFFAKTYSEVCKEARSSFAQQRLGSAHEEQVRRTRLLCQDPMQDRSPYSMEDDDPQKYFISGFTGFVPRARFLIGTGYPITTNRALLEFSQMTLRKGGRSRTEKGGVVLSPLGKTYPADRGLLPHYAGYVPGYKFQFGHTYGHLTHNALGLSALEKKIPD
ncbi:protein FAM166B [Oxyura jamaicensis]|uniref:protein FAM166B n=1 Tax=Oxyura jamaicensis TaxID=8884 RepID=UPI0015A64F97|nr:protein FAM166B [Oxyura jamaicensis]